MNVSLRVRDYMVADPITVRPDAEIMSVARLLVENDVSGVIVVDGENRVVGMLTERDFIAVALNSGYFDERGGSVAEYMSKDVETVNPNESLVDVAARFVRSPYRRYPVVEDGRLVGVICRRDALRALKSDSWFSTGSDEHE